MTERKGIDVSKHNGIIDWKKVADSGVSVAIIRAGYGQTVEDIHFLKNIKGALANGIEVGIYWFMYATNKQEAIANAEKCAKIIEPYKDQIKHRVWSDWEYDSDKKSIAKGVYQSRETRTEMVYAFCQTLAKKGYEVGIYANPDYIKTKFNYIGNYPLWLAQYSSKKSYDCYMWQYTSKGNVPGISGNVDLNKVYFSKDNMVPNDMPLLKKGSRGEYVKLMQEILNRKGFNCGKADGIFGTNTLNAVICFQGMNGLVKDGKVGKLTWSELLS